MRRLRPGALTAAFTAIVVAAVAGSAPPDAGAATLRLGFADGVFTTSADERDPWLERARSVGADFVRLDISWVSTAPEGPTGDFDAADPADPGYDFANADAAVRGARARGMDVLLSFTGAPAYARETVGRPTEVDPAAWRPRAAALRDWGKALARRYSGRFADPLAPGSTLPRVTALQPWNEPNLRRYLAPQWERRDGALRPVAAVRYRAMLRAFATGVQEAGARQTVVSAGTAPFGDLSPGGSRTPPVAFWRQVLCLAGAPRDGCERPARFDALAHHPYATGSPARRAINADDASIADLGKLRALLRQARRPARLWVTEVSYDSSPPDPQGVPAARHARWLAETVESLARQGAEAVTWFLVRDAVPVPSFAATNQSGVFLRDGTPKPAARAFALPLVARRVAAGAGVELWVRAPRTGTLVIAQRGRAILRRSVRAGEVVRATRRVRGAAPLRASLGELVGDPVRPLRARSVGLT